MTKSVWGKWTTNGKNMVGYTDTDNIGCPFCGTYDWYISDYHLDGMFDDPVWLILEMICPKCDGKFTFVMERVATDWEEVDESVEASQ